jgi:hypothetical protein
MWFPFFDDLDQRDDGCLSTFAADIRADPTAYTASRQSVVYAVALPFIAAFPRRVFPVMDRAQSECTEKGEFDFPRSRDGIFVGTIAGVNRLFAV